MFTTNPFSELVGVIPPIAMQIYVVLMLLLVIAGTVFDIIHKKSGKYFFAAGEKWKAKRTHDLSAGERMSVAVKTAAHDVLASGEFCNPRRRLSHLLTMYGFILFVVTTAIMVFGYSAPDSITPGILPVLWYLGALMAAIGGYWFWFAIRVDVAAEGNPWYRIVRADLFILSLLATVTFAFIWGVVQTAGAEGWGYLFFALFIVSATVLFGGVPWSKFAHMFYKPAAAYQKRLTEADGSLMNLPPPADKPKQFGLGIDRELPRHY